MTELVQQPAPPKELRQIVSYSLLSGLCPLIPIPLLDDWARDLLRRRLVVQLAMGTGVNLDDDEIKTLANGYHPTRPGGCLLGCLVLRPLLFLSQLIFRKLMRKILFFLTLRDTVSTFSDTFHEGYLVRYALDRGALASIVTTPATAPSNRSRSLAPQVLAVRRAIENSVRAADTRPVTSLVRSLFKGSWRGLLMTARRMTRVLRKSRKEGEAQLSDRLQQEGEERLGSLIDELTADLAHQDSYLKHLESELDQRLAET